jgi:hypothetical protein
MQTLTSFNQERPPAGGPVYERRLANLLLAEERCLKAGSDAAWIWFKHYNDLKGRTNGK